MGEQPSGTVTFLFTDIEGSTRLWEEWPDEMQVSLAEHDSAVRAAVEAHGGYVFATGGDGFAVAFHRAGDAVDAAVKVQAELAGHLLLRVRMGVHTGEVQERGGDYFGPAVNRAARLMAVGHGGQVLVSAATESLLDEAVPLRDLGEHRLRDLSGSQRVFQVGDESFGALRSVDIVPSNLPTMLTELVGRSSDIEELTDLVLGDRVVTLTGTGGVGKTRLSLAVAAAVSAEFFDGVWLVELAAEADAAGVVRATASALGVEASLDQAGLVEYLRGRRLMLVLDNCEHVLDAAADFVTGVVAGAAGVHVVVTSREPLDVEGEVVRRVRSLGLPDREAGAAAVDGADAVRMFVDRASAASGDFELDATNRAAVVEICRRLDGIPLALELAAARVRGLNPAQIADRLDERFRLLSGGRRGQERHQTLQAAVSWSYDLLDTGEKQLFRRLSVFAASFDLAAAESVSGDGADVFEDLLHLVDRSLVQHDAATGRYRLLETLRQFGAERVVETGEAEEIRDLYIGHFLRLTTNVGPGIKDPERFTEAFATLNAEMDNIAAVAEMLFSDRRWGDLLSLCQSNAVHLVSSGDQGVMRRLTAAVDAGVYGDSEEQVDALAMVAVHSARTASFDLVVQRANECLTLAERTNTPPPAGALVALALVATYQGRFDDYLTHTTAAMNAADRNQDRFLWLQTRSQWLDAHLRVHGYDGNEAIIDEVLRDTSEHPIPHSVAVLAAASTAVLFDRDLTRGLSYLDTVEELSGIPTIHGAWLGMQKAMALTDTDPSAGVTFAVQAARLADRAASLPALQGALLTLGLLATRIDRLDAAQQLCAHTAAFPEAQVIAAFAWVQTETIDALAAAGVATPVAAHELSRQELFAILNDLEAST
jgi:predicted ATPase/class 3 adenylate cyclase